ncbi:MAG: hypothetical protein EBR49_05520 [Betaproteobacteria bacterium]|nr:hypothetical protein [Betaproteobacteria bacterium]
MRQDSKRLAIERTVRARKPDGSLTEPRTLVDYQSLRAWVLLGDPGAGKTTTFETLAKQEGGECLKASDFLELTPRDSYRHPIFIDGLDEAAALEGQSPLGRIRSKLSALDIPPFRLSCREADWRGSTDSDALQRLAGEGDFAELHLTELNDGQILQFTASWLDVSEADAQAFVDQAHHKDLGGLLTNPQTLRMLVEAVGKSSEGWPRSKAEVYEKACAKLVQEQNEVHLAAQRRSTIPDAQLLNAAGYLCAVMLLSGSAVIALQHKKQDTPHAMVLTTLLTSSATTPSTEACNKVLETHLFSSDGKGNFTPVHRTVAEYLGAKYLAERIRNHLPAKRVLALIQGEDGGVVPELRGLHAWLAVVTDKSVRSTLIDQDALGLVLHGDVLGFSVDEKKSILQALQREAQRYAHFRNQNWANRPFGALATEDMEPAFREWLESPDRSPAHQAVLDCVLDAMEHGQAMPDLTTDLERIVGDKSCWSGLRRSALNTLCNYSKQAKDWSAPLRILRGIHQYDIRDEDDSLLGILLRELYPRFIAPEELWSYYHPHSQTSINQYWMFWNDLAKDHAPHEDVPVLLDALLASGRRLRSTGEEYDLSQVIGNLLLAGLSCFGQKETAPRLYAWLGLVIGAYRDNALQSEAREAIARWFEANPSVYKRLVEHGIAQRAASDQPAHLWLSEIHQMLCEAPRPNDAVDWYLFLAEDQTGAIRQQLIGEAFRLAEHREGANATIARMERWTAQHPQDAEWILNGWLSCPYPPDEETQGWRLRSAERKQKDAQKHAEDLQFFCEELPKLQGNEAHQGLLIHIGQRYLQGVRNSSKSSPENELRQLFNEDPHWVSMALDGLRQCLYREDLPDAQTILNSYLKSKYFPISHACLAAMDLRFSESPTSALELSEQTLEMLIAFEITGLHGNPPAWFKQLLQDRDDLVGQVMLNLMRMQIAAKVEHVNGLYALAHDVQYIDIAQQVAPLLIAELPARVTKTQLRCVRELIACLLRTLPESDQLSLISQRLSIPNMDVAQRVYWLTAGLQVAPTHYLEPLKRYLDGKPSRASHVYELLREQRQERDHAVQLGLNATMLLIPLLGARFTPQEEPKSGEAYWVSPAMESMRYVQQLVSSMAADPSEEAHAGLRQLMAQDGLAPWKDQLEHALYEQNLLRRKALFRPASVTEVCHTLANQQPANAADLHALVVDQLNLLAKEIRHGNTNDYTQYWNGDKPRIENDCRDALLSDLKKLLNPLNVIAEPERPHADHKRADIEVFFGSTLHIPIEIKRDSHKDVWKAIHEQLIAKYSREQGSDGYGVYIVFWFDPKNLHVAGDGGNKPKTPLELQQRLAATVPRELQHKITVLVIDCAKP